MLCSSSEIGTYDPCFFAVFQGSSNYTECHFTTFESEATCLSKILNDVVIISMVQPSIAHFDAHKNPLLHAKIEVESFDVIVRVPATGTVPCVPSETRHIYPILAVPALAKSTENITIQLTESDTTVVSRAKSVKDQFHLFQHQMDLNQQNIEITNKNHLELLKNIEVNSTLYYVKSELQGSITKGFNWVNHSAVKLITFIGFLFTSICVIFKIFLYLCEKIAYKATHSQMTFSAADITPDSENSQICEIQEKKSRKKLKTKYQNEP